MTAPRGEHHTARRYEVHHRTEYTYAADVTASFGRACLRPRETASQHVLSHRIDIEPTPDVFEEHLDFFGNYSHHLEISTPHRRLLVEKTSTVEVHLPPVDLGALDGWTVGEAADALRADPTVDPVERAAFVLPSALVTLADGVVSFSQALVWPDRPLGEAIGAVVHEIHAGFAYEKGVTSVATTLHEIAAIARRRLSGLRPSRGRLLPRRRAAGPLRQWLSGNPTPARTGEAGGFGCDPRVGVAPGAGRRVDRPRPHQRPAG